MEKSRLTPDYIEWVLKLNADQAVREMHKVNEQTKEFEKANHCCPLKNRIRYFVDNWIL